MRYVHYWVSDSDWCGSGCKRSFDEKASTTEKVEDVTCPHCLLAIEQKANEMLFSVNVARRKMIEG